MTIHIRILPNVLHTWVNRENDLLLFTAMPVYIQGECVHFKYLESMLKFSWNRYTDPNWPDPDWHALDADPDPAKQCGSDPIRINNTDYGSSLLCTVHRTILNFRPKILKLSIFSNKKSPFGPLRIISYRTSLPPSTEKYMKLFKT
jgi:hypothetical protein